MRVSIVGGGAWGVALCRAAASAGSLPLLCSRRLTRVSGDYRITQSMKEAAAHAELLVLAVPSPVMRTLARELGDSLDGRHTLVHAGRGLVDRLPDSIDPRSMVTASHVLREETPVRRVGAMGGPALAEELSRGAPSVCVVGSHFPEVFEAMRGAFGSPTFRLYTTSDLVGLEWASALTGILAVAVGYARGIGLGAGVVAAFATRGVHEAASVGALAGAEASTFFGLGGFGDLLSAIASEDRPEVRLGYRLATGMHLSEALSAIGERVEAVELAPKVLTFARSKGAKTPIFQVVAEGLFGHKPPEELVTALMAGPIVDGK